MKGIFFARDDVAVVLKIIYRCYQKEEVKINKEK
jgi:hypothetical protein